jgi:hypothetical protein
MKTQSLYSIVGALVAALLLPFTSHAANIASDNASDPIYSDMNGWADGENGGTGFGAWFLNTSGTGSMGFFTGTAYANSMGTSFGIYANSSTAEDTPLAEAIRSFNPLSTALDVDDVFSFQLSLNHRNSYKGMELRVGGNAIVRFEISDNFGAGNQIQLKNIVTDETFSLFSGTYSATALFDLAFVMLPGNEIGVGISYDAEAGPYSTTLTGFSSLPDNVRFYVYDTATGSENNLYVNNMATVPEPSSMALLGISAMALLIRRRK